MLRKLFGRIFNPASAGPAANGRTILLIDDGEVERKTTSAVLGKRGYKVLTAENGEIGLKLAQEQRPDLILLDFMMPGMMGKEVCQRLKQIPATKDIPVIFLTGSIAPKSVIDCYEVGAEYYLAKPISARTLINQVEMIFNELKPKDAS